MMMGLLYSHNRIENTSSGEQKPRSKSKGSVGSRDDDGGGWDATCHGQAKVLIRTMDRRS